MNGQGAYEEKFFENIREKVKRTLLSQHESNVDIALWAFYYNSNAEMLLHWILLHPNENLKNNPLITSVRIPAGYGTIGYVLLNKEGHGVDDTFDDPRGTVGVEDAIIGNNSWYGIPVIENDEVVAIISFFPVEKLDEDWQGSSYNWEKVLEASKKKAKTIVSEVVNSHAETIRAYARYKQQFCINEILTRSFGISGISGHKYTDKLLDQIRELSYEIRQFSWLLYLQKKQRTTNSYTITEPIHIKHDYLRTCIRVLQEWQWKAIYPNPERDSHVMEVQTDQLPDRVIDIAAPKVAVVGKGDFSIKLYFENEATENEMNKLKNYFAQLVDFMSYLRGESFADSRDKKIRLEAMAMTCRFWYEQLVSDDVDKGIIEKFCRFVNNQFSRRQCQNHMNLYNNAQCFSPASERPSAEYLIGVSLWVSILAWTITAFEGIDEQSLKMPWVWKPLVRAVEEEEQQTGASKGLLQKYPPTIIGIPNCWKVTKNNNDDSFRIKNGDISIDCKKQEGVDFPIALILHPPGLDFYLYKKYGRSMQFSEKDNSVYRETDDSEYRVLAKEGHRIVAIR